jgi:hypothetical protein
MAKSKSKPKPAAAVETPWNIADKVDNIKVAAASLAESVELIEVASLACASLGEVGEGHPISAILKIIKTKLQDAVEAIDDL